MIICTQCGFSNDEGDRFCGGCQEFLEWSGKAADSAPEQHEVEAELELEDERKGLVGRVVERLSGQQEGESGHPAVAVVDVAPAQTDTDAQPIVDDAATSLHKEAAAKAEREAEGAERAAQEARARLAAEAEAAEEAQRRAAEAEAAQRAAEEKRRELAEAAAKAEADAAARAEAEAAARAEAEAKAAAEAAQRAEAEAAERAEAEAADQAARESEAAAKGEAEGTAKAAHAASTAASAVADAAETTDAEAEAARIAEAARAEAAREARQAAEKAQAEAAEREKKEREKKEREQAAREQAQREQAEREEAERKAAELRAQAEAEAAEKAAREAAEAAAKQAAEAEAARKAAEEQARKDAEAAERARRAAALIARPPEPKPTPPPTAGPTPVAPPKQPAKGAGRRARGKPATEATAAAAEATATETSDPGPVAVAPGKSKVRPTAKSQDTAPQRRLRPGDLICGNCGEGNTPTRNFCHRCGQTLTEAEIVRAPWWKRPFQRKPKVYEAGTRPGRGGKKKLTSARGIRGKIGAVKRVVLGPVAKVGRILAMVGMLAAAVGLGVNPNLRGTVMDFGGNMFQTVRNWVSPQYEPIHGVAATATSSVEDHEAIRAVDLSSNRWWAANPASGNGIGERLRVEFPEPVDIAVIAVIPGAAQNYLDHPRPKELHFVFSNEATATFENITDEHDFQHMNVSGAEGVEWVEVHVRDVWHGQSTNNLSITSIEFRTRS